MSNVDNQQPVSGSGNGGEQPKPAPTDSETISKADHDRELDRYRNQVGQLNTQLSSVKAELDQIKNASKSETEKLQEKANLADQLKPQVERLSGALKAEVEARKATLPAELAALLPEGDEVMQLDWMRKASAAADKIKPQQQLPASGGRNPAMGGQNAQSQMDRAITTYPILKRRRVKGE